MECREDRIQCRNPSNELIVEMLIEMERQALMECHPYNNYRGPIKNIQRCPFAITNKKEAKKIKGIGDKIANLIVCHLNGNDPSDLRSRQRKIHSIPQEKEALYISMMRNCGRNLSKQRDDECADYQMQSLLSDGNKRKKKQKKKKIYIPKALSGGYAILLQMYSGKHKSAL